MPKDVDDRADAKGGDSKEQPRIPGKMDGHFDPERAGYMWVVLPFTRIGRVTRTVAPRRRRSLKHRALAADRHSRRAGCRWDVSCREPDARAGVQQQCGGWQVASAPSHPIPAASQPPGPPPRCRCSLAHCAAKRAAESASAVPQHRALRYAAWPQQAMRAEVPQPDAARTSFSGSAREQRHSWKGRLPLPAAAAPAARMQGARPARARCPCGRRVRRSSLRQTFPRQRL